MSADRAAPATGNARAGSGAATLARLLAWAVALLTLLASAAGLLVPGVYRDAAALVELTRADDVFRIVVLVPLLAIGLWASRRGSVVGSLTALGVLLALAYLYGFLAFGAALGALTLAHVVLLGLAFWAVLLGFLELDPARVEASIGACLPRRATAAFLVAMAILSAIQWGWTIVAAGWSATLPAEVVAYDWSTSPLYAIELAFFVPLLAGAGVQLVRRRPGGSMLAVPLLVLLASLGLGLAWEPVFGALEGRPLDLGIVAAGIVFLLLPAALLGATGRRLRLGRAAP